MEGMVMNIVKNINDLKIDILRNKNVGTFSWFLHRITGLLLVFYICLHLCVLGSDSLFGKGTFDLLMGQFKITLFKLMEIGLIGTVAFHLLNGLRVIFADFLALTRSQKILFWAVALLLVAIIAVTFIVYFYV